MAGIESLQEGPAVFARLFNAGDLDGFVSLYEADAVLEHHPGKPAKGAGAIRDEIAGLMEGGSTFTVARRQAAVSGEVALASYGWKIERADGSTEEGVGAIVLHRQPEGSWRATHDIMHA